MATTTLTLLTICVIAPLGAFTFDRSLFGTWIWHIAPDKAIHYRSIPASPMNPPFHLEERG